MTPPRPDDVLFVYGTLRDPAFTSRLLERDVTSERAALPGFEVLRIEGYPLPAIFAAEGESVVGGLYRGLRETDYDRLDRYEGVEDGLYRREVVQVKPDRPEATLEPACVYLLTEKSLRRLGAL